jgi:restriction system protein
MSSKYRYQKVINNSYLKKVMVIKGNTRAEVETKAVQQIAKWDEQEANLRDKERLVNLVSNLKLKAEGDNQYAQERLAALNQLLVRGLNRGNRFDWNLRKNHRAYPPFEFRESAPTYAQVAQMLQVPPQKPFLESVFSGSRKKREDLEARAREELSRLNNQQEARKAQAIQLYEEQRRTYEYERAKYNTSINEKRTLFEAGDNESVKWFLKQILDNLDFPEDYGKDFEIAFDFASGIGIISMQLPNLIEVPRTIGYKYIASRKVIDTIEMKQKEYEAFYDSIIYQMALLTIHRIFREVYISSFHSAVFNGWVTGVDQSTGNDFTSCVLSVQASREAFQSINLERVNPKECIRNLKGIVAGPLAQLAPVRPIMELDTFDKRFVESREVLAGLNATDNLATMDWEDFEHLVRELFGKLFGGEGSEVRVTQASRDGGVDAVAFDPDPIRGGKFIIQAKRYNNVVPVSAVRDLYGTVINEGAAKGFLVTTSYFGNDSREFVKNKPIALIDGSNLIHMFQQHGYDFRIELQ